MTKTVIKPGLVVDFRGSESWRVLRVMSEMVESFEQLEGEQIPLVTIFGSARTNSEDPECKSAEKLAQLLVKNQYGVVTGGGPGIMQAANKGAKLANGVSVGLNIELPMEQHPNVYQTHSLFFRYFFLRKLDFVKYSVAFVGYPGGIGTLDEFFEVLTLVQTHKINPVPIVLVGVEFWIPLIDWMRNTMLKSGKISAKDFDLFYLVDTPEEAMAYILLGHSVSITSTVKPYAP